MDIALLSSSSRVHSTARLITEAEKRGHYIELIDPSLCSLRLFGGKPRIHYRAEDITESFDAVIPRIGLRLAKHGSSIVKQFELNGVYCTTTASSLVKARNKLECLQYLSRKGIPFPRTLFCSQPERLEEQVSALGGLPFVLKVLEGTQGIGVVLAESMPAARSIFETFLGMDKSVMLQEYIGEANGQDMRLFVIGNKVAACIQRTSAPGDFRSNVHRGGSAVPVTPTYQEANMALKATKYLGLGVAGVDLIRSDRGPLLLEVNASPGLRAIEEVSGKNIASRIIKFIEKNAIS